MVVRAPGHQLAALLSQEVRQGPAVRHHLLAVAPKLRAGHLAMDRFRVGAGGGEGGLGKGGGGKAEKKKGGGGGGVPLSDTFTHFPPSNMFVEYYVGWVGVEFQRRPRVSQAPENSTWGARQGFLHLLEATRLASKEPRFRRQGRGKL